MEDISRYDKQIKISYLGSLAQENLLNSHVAVVGLGALGASVAEQLVRAGVGTLTLVDRDYVEISNLQRQMLYNEQDIENQLPKAIAALNRLSTINSSIQLRPFVAHLNARNIEDILSPAQLIIDATDNLKTRYLINEFAIKEKKIWIHGAVASTYGRVISFIPESTPCFRCIYPHVPELDHIDTCDTVGVLGSIVSIIASIQVTEAIKALTDNKQYISKSLVEFNVWTQKLMKINLESAKQHECPVCQKKQYPLLFENEVDQKNIILCGRNTIQAHHPSLTSETYPHYIEKLKISNNVSINRYLTKIKLKTCTVTLFPDGRCLIHGIDNLEDANNVLAELFDY